MVACPRHQFYSVLTVAILTIVGCGESSNMVAVQGHVSYRGEALSNSSVTFFPATGRPVNAGLSTAGEYSVDLAPGEYVVTISYTEPLPPGYKEGDPLPPPKIVLPPEYATRAKSTLMATVAPDQSQPIDFKLE